MRLCSKSIVVPQILRLIFQQRQEQIPKVFFQKLSSLGNFGQLVIVKPTKQCEQSLSRLQSRGALARIIRVVSDFGVADVA